MYLQKVCLSCVSWHKGHHNLEHMQRLCRSQDLTSVLLIVTWERRNHSTFCGMDVGASPQQIHSPVQLKVPCCSCSPLSLSFSALLEVPPWLLLSEPVLLFLGSQQGPKSTRRILAEAQKHQCWQTERDTLPWLSLSDSWAFCSISSRIQAISWVSWSSCYAKALVWHFLSGHPPPAVTAGCSAPFGWCSQPWPGGGGGKGLSWAGWQRGGSWDSRDRRHKDLGMWVRGDVGTQGYHGWGWWVLRDGTTSPKPLGHSPWLTALGTFPRSWGQHLPCPGYCPKPLASPQPQKHLLAWSKPSPCLPRSPLLHAQLCDMVCLMSLASEPHAGTPAGQPWPALDNALNSAFSAEVLKQSYSPQ